MAERDDLWQIIYNADPPMPCRHFANRQRAGWDVCAECEADWLHAAVINYLTESGRLLPPGGEVSTWWGVLNVNGCGAAIFRSRAAAEEHARDYPVDDGDYLASRTVTTWGEGRDQTRLVGPWEVVPDDEATPTGGVAS